jgi:hypothetical protein
LAPLFVIQSCVVSKFPGFLPLFVRTTSDVFSLFPEKRESPQEPLVVARSQELADARLLKPPSF